LLGFIVPVSALASCSDSSHETTPSDASVADASLDAPSDEEAIEEIAPPSDGSTADFCDLPGSLVFESNGSKRLVSGGKKNAPSLSWLTLPEGFCAHYFANVTTARQIRFAPGGELFVASPSTGTAGGAPIGLGAIVVLADDDHDGYADGDVLPHSDGTAENPSLFMGGIASTQGLLFAAGSFYYQDSSSIMKLPYSVGERTAKGTPEMIADITVFPTVDHWPKTLDMADDGTIYVGNGGDQNETCDTTVFPRPFHGGVLKIGGADDPIGGTQVSMGFRNPIAIRCQAGHNLCFSIELGKDGTFMEGGREKLVQIRNGDDWGYPCCATKNLPYPGVTGANCSSVASERVAFEIGDTPFGFDFEAHGWPAPFTKNILVATHGQVGSWEGARVVAIATQANGMPVVSSDLVSETGLRDFATGWPGASATQTQGRPSAVTFAADGRLFVANDQDGDIFWVAPIGVGPDR
jgi:glucose/arabinose dehydrogenase